VLILSQTKVCLLHALNHTKYVFLVPVEMGIDLDFVLRGMQMDMTFQMFILCQTGGVRHINTLHVRMNVPKDCSFVKHRVHLRKRNNPFPSSEAFFRLISCLFSFLLLFSASFRGSFRAEVPPETRFEMCKQAFLHFSLALNQI
jgi:hypothetical protein